MFEPDFSKSQDGLIPVIVQDSADGRVLMLAYINRDAWQKTLATKTATYWSRSRRQLWVKGETSGNSQKINDILVDCDEDAIVFQVTQEGEGACHTGHRSCFYRHVTDDGELEELDTD